MNPLRKPARILAATIAGSILLAGGVSAAAPAFAVSAPALLTAIDSSVLAVAAHQSVFDEAFLWSNIHADRSMDALYSNRRVVFVGGVPSQLTPTVSYINSAAGEAAWEYTPAVADLATQVYITATRISDGATVQSPVVHLGFVLQDWRPSGGTVPSGTSADWAWTAPMATLDNKYSWGIPLDGTDQQWTTNARCLAVPLGAYTAPVGPGWTHGAGSDFTPSPSSMGAMSDGTPDTQVDVLDGVSFVPEAGQVQGYQPYFTSTMAVDVASACPGLQLTGKMWINAADIKTGSFQLSDAPGSAGNHLSWDASGAPGTGVVTSADVTATPDGSGGIAFSFAKTPLRGESGSGAVRVWAQTKAGTQVRVTVGYSWSNYGGAPTASDLAVPVPLGTTVTVTESQLLAHAQFYSAQAETIDVAALPSGVTQVTTATGERAFQYTGSVAGETKRFAFTASETQSPAGIVKSAPAAVVFTVLNGSQSDPGPVSPPATSAPKPLPVVSG